MVTLHDLAQACGCSITSVSRAIKDSNTISRALRAKVNQKAIELGYIPNGNAKSMRMGRTNTIAVIMQDTMNPYYSIVARTVERYAAELKYNVIIFTTDYHTERELGAVYEALKKQVNGVLLFPLQVDSKSLDVLDSSGRPYVLVGRSFEDRAIDCVMPDDRQGVYLTTRHLLEKGHKRILMINSFKHISSTRLREEGFRAAMTEAKCLVRDGDVHYISTDKGVCARLVEDIFSREHDYTAVCCYNDLLAYEAYYHLRVMGYSIPDDIALTGVDDLHSYLTFPVRMTSAGYDIQGVLARSVDLLLGKIQGGRAEAPVDATRQDKLILFNQYLVVGETT